MDILPSPPLGKAKRLFSILIVLLLTLGGLFTILSFAIPVEAEDYQPFAPKPGERQGDYYMSQSPPEFEISGESQYNYFGTKMKKLDFNNDGFEDLAIAAYGADSYVGAVYIFDGSYQVTFPRLREDASGARWKLAGPSGGSSTYFGTDFYIGDVNGDGADDVLVGAPYAQVYNESSGRMDYGVGAAYLFFGGAYRDSGGSTIAASNANASFHGIESYRYFAKAVGIADIDNDGFDEVFVSRYSYLYKYTSSPRKYEYLYKGYSYYWYGSSSFSGAYYIGEDEFDGRIGGNGEAKRIYNYGSYSREYVYDYFALGNYAVGDMNGDGVDEIAFGSPYQYRSPYPGSTSPYPAGAVQVFSPDTSTLKTGGKEFFLVDDNTYGEWAIYWGPTYTYSYLGYPISMNDTNGDGYDDLWIGSPRYPSYSNGRLYYVKGSSTFETGDLEITSSGVYDAAFRASSSVRYFGAHAFGDYDGDGLTDLAVGGQSAVYILENSEIDVASGTTVYCPDNDMITYYAPSGTQYFAYSGNYYSSGTSSPHFPIVFWNRDDADLCDDVFISDYYYRADNTYGVGRVWGVSNYDMFGIGTFESLNPDEPDAETFYAEHRPYTFRMSAWNKWDAEGTEKMVADIHLGDYTVTVEYTLADGLQLLNDPLDAVILDPDFKTYVQNSTFTMFVEFNLTFTLNLRDECDVDVDFAVFAQHIYYDESYEDVGKIRNKFLYTGYLETYWVKETGKDPIDADSWMPGDRMIEFTGMQLTYNGTQEWDTPLFPRDELFYMSVKNNLGNETIDNTSSGRNFLMQLGVENKPIEVIFTIEQVGIPANKLINGVPSFNVRVDTDDPTIVPGIQIHADDYDDPNTLVDNEGELYVTWQPPGEYNSGIHHYEFMVNEDESNISEVKSTFAKVFTTSTGRVNVSVRAIDRVEHVGEWGSSFIFIDDQTLAFSNFFPGPDDWFNTMTPEVGITITDVGGRAVVGSSVEYSVSYDGGTTYGDWISGGTVLNAENLMVVVEPALMEGSDNMVKFRAMDEAGNLLVSDGGSVNVDVSGVEFGELLVEGSEDWDGIWWDSGDIQVGITISDALSGVDPSTVEYRLTTRGRADLNSAVWMPVTDLKQANEIDIVLDDIMLDMGDRNYIQFRGRDVLENPFAYSPAFNLWVNTAPVPVISSPEDGAGFLNIDIVTFDAMKSSDYDGDALTYTWVDTIITDTDNVTENIGEGSIEDFKRFEIKLTPGEHYIRLMVSDGLHDVYSEQILILIEEYDDPIWNNAEDEDQDGMPNWFEFNFHLGWNDGSNKDSLYNPTAHDSQTKAELWVLFEDEYKDKKVTVTSENDFDGDGHTDYEEYLSNSDPTDETDFPLYKLEGEEVDKELNLLLLIAVIVSVLLVIIVLVLLVVNNIAIKNKLEQEAVKDAENEQAMLEQAMLAGGSARLEALKAASEGRPVALPTAPPTGSALPAAPFDAAPMGEAQPMEAAPMEPTPIPAPYEPAPQQVDTQGGFPPQ